MDPVPVRGLRTDAGALLRSGLDQIAALPLPEGSKGQLVVVTDLQEYYIGTAIRLPKGWQIDAGISGAIRDGKTLKATASVRW